MFTTAKSAVGQHVYGVVFAFIVRGPRCAVFLIVAARFFSRNCIHNRSRRTVRHRAKLKPVFKFLPLNIAITVLIDGERKPFNHATVNVAIRGDCKTISHFVKA
jgi:hypothetical protein